MSGPVRYQPLDSLLAQPQVRALRKLKRFDWATIDTLYPDAQPTEKHSAWRALKKLLAAGLVEIRVGKHHEYRITSEGRKRLERLLRPDPRVSL